MIQASSKPPPILVPQPWHSLQPGAPFLPHCNLDPRDQVLCDLVYLFNNTLRTYAPAAGHEILLQLPGMQLPGAQLPAATQPSLQIDQKIGFGFRAQNAAQVGEIRLLSSSWGFVKLALLVYYDTL